MLLGLFKYSIWCVSDLQKAMHFEASNGYATTFLEGPSNIEFASNSKQIVNIRYIYETSSLRS